MNPLARRRNQPDPAEQRKTQEEVRRQIALAVSLAEKKTKEKTQREVLEALSAITGQ